MKPERVLLPSEQDLLDFGAGWALDLKRGDLVLLSGPLGAGKTTLVRAILRALGWNEPVRSPTFNLIHTFETKPPIMHADLYRVESATGLGLEELLESHLTFIEWPDRLHGALDEMPRWEVELDFHDAGRQLVRRRAG